MKINFQFKPADFSRTMKNLQADYEKEITEAIAMATKQTSYEAKREAPVDKSGLRSSIHTLIKPMQGEVEVRAEYAPFVEFGTGSGVSVPAELTSYAMQFKGRGFTGRLPVFINKVGWRMVQFPVSHRARPFLWPAFVNNREKFTYDMQRRIDKIANRNWR